MSWTQFICSFQQSCQTSRGLLSTYNSSDTRSGSESPQGSIKTRACGRPEQLSCQILNANSACFVEYT